MDTKTLSDFIAWSKKTDLQEVLFKKDGVCVEISTAAKNPKASDFSCKLTAVKAPAVGIYNSGLKGKAVVIKENMPVKQGDILGYVEMNKTLKEVNCPVAGTLKINLAKDGAAVEYGQPLFFIEP